MHEPARKCGRPLEPVTFFRPLKAGVPRLGEKLEVLLQASLAGDQILFGVDAGSQEEAICEEARRHLFCAKILTQLVLLGLWLSWMSQNNRLPTVPSGPLL